VYTASDGAIVWKVNCLLESDILVCICSYKEGKRDKRPKKPLKMFRYSFHCAFVEEDGSLFLKPAEFDIHSNKKFVFIHSFGCFFFFLIINLFKDLRFKSGLLMIFI